MFLVDKLRAVMLTRKLRPFLDDLAQILDRLEGIGCTIERDGLNWKINVDSFGGGGGGLELSTDTPADVGASGSTGTASDVLPSDHVHRAPHWNQMQDATAATTIQPAVGDDDLYNLYISDTMDRWKNVYIDASTLVDISCDNGELIVGPITYDAPGELSVNAHIDIVGGGSSPNALYLNGTQVVGRQKAAVSDASGGSTIDAEARIAINSLLARCRLHGLIAT